MSFDIDTDSSLRNMIGFMQFWGYQGIQCVFCCYLFSVDCCNITEGTGFIRAKH